MTPSARLGDKHVCPLPGHATTPIASARGETFTMATWDARVASLKALF